MGKAPCQKGWGFRKAALAVGLIKKFVDADVLHTFWRDRGGGLQKLTTQREIKRKRKKRSSPSKFGALK